MVVACVFVGGTDVVSVPEAVDGSTVLDWVSLQAPRPMRTQKAA